MQPVNREHVVERLHSKTDALKQSTKLNTKQTVNSVKHSL